MAYTLEELSRDIKSALTANASSGDMTDVLGHVSRALNDEEFIATHVTEDACKPRKVLYEDPDNGFCICGHVYDGIREGGPHDHGSSWAIYGVAVGETEMTDWEIVKQGSGDDPTLVREVRKYLMRPGDAHFYPAGAVHSPRTETPVKLVRIEGKNLDHVQRSNIRAA